MNILELIPQRAPIVMVDNFLGIEDGVSYTEFNVREDNIMVENGVLSECGLIEHIAQSAAARVGYIFKSQNQNIPIGYIGSVNKFSVETLPPVGSKINTEVTVLQEVGGISLIEAACRIAGEYIAGCRMKIFLDTNDQA